MSSLRLIHLSLQLVAEQDLQLPAHNKGNALRGGFGTAFRRLVCVDMRWECAACTLRYDCPYTTVFNPFVPPDAERLTRNHNIPRPFVFKPPRSLQTHYGRGEPLVFQLVVVGRAIDYLPYFIVAFRELGVLGFGLNRARVRLARVDALGADGSTTPVYDATANLVRAAPPLTLGVDVPDDQPTAGDTLVLDFLTPTTLRAGSAVHRDAVAVHSPAFHHILKRLRDRLNALATFYGNGPLDLEFKALGDAAEAVQTVDDQTRWVERARFSARRSTPHDLSGFVGRIAFRGGLARFLPILRAGEYIHVGKNAVFGNGWFKIEAFLPSGR
jgi:CRISPR/Cas system endoribonuclease Cas6 (RAMP superfamily)